jgi:UDP-N-acetylglucosamine:LPS N-acetylglucosamine transferase
MESKKRALILTADAGFGHRSAALAVKDALQDKYADQMSVEVVNPLDEPTTPNFLRDTQADYDKYLHYVPDLYAFGYEATDNLIPTALLERTIGVLLVDTMREVFSKFKPDVVLSVYPWYQSAISTLYTGRKNKVPHFTVVTDLSTVHRMWFHKKVTGCLVPNTLVAELGMSYGMPLEKIIITGIPVSPAITKEKREKNEIRKELGWQPDLPTILAVGSKRVERLIDSLNVINHFGAPIQVAVVCGKDENLFRELTHFEWHIPAYIYEYSDQVPTLMKASDLMLCKAGGLIVTESLASGLPMMLTEIIPGQETGNAEYVTAYGAADMAESPIAILECLHHLMKDDQALLKKRAANARFLGQPESAYAVADILWKSSRMEVRKSVHRILHNEDKQIK